MNIRNFTTLSLLGGALLVPAFAEKVKLEQLPTALQEKIRSQVGSAQIEDIDRDVKNGKTTYEVAFKNAQGQNTELVFEDSGSLVGSGSSTALDSRKITYKELPVPVRRTADNQISGGEVNDVERRVRNGRVTYGIGFKGANGAGPQRELIIDSQGNLIRGNRPSGRGTENTTSATSSPVPAASIAARTMSYDDLPQNVRTVAQTHLKNGHVERAERRVQNGEIDYTLLFKKEDGQYQQMVIAEDGRVVSNQMVQTAAVGSSGTVQSGATTPVNVQNSPHQTVTKPVQLSNSEVIDRSQVPPEVRAAIREQTRNGNVEEILRGNWSGKEIYQVAFTDQNKKYMEVQLDQKGQVIYDPRTSGTTTKESSNSTDGSLRNKIGRFLDNDKK